MLTLPDLMASPNNAQRAQARADAAQGHTTTQPTSNAPAAATGTPTANQRPPGGVGRQTAQAAVVAEEVAELGIAMVQAAKDYEADGLTEPAELLRNQAKQLGSYACLLTGKPTPPALVLNDSPIDPASQGGPLVTASLWDQPAESEPEERTVASLGLLDPTAPLPTPSVWED